MMLQTPEYPFVYEKIFSTIVDKNLFLAVIIYSTCGSPELSSLPAKCPHAERYCGNSLQNGCNYSDNIKTNRLWQK
jgi:hypothetical protein